MFVFQSPEVPTLHFVREGKTQGGQQTDRPRRKPQEGQQVRFPVLQSLQKHFSNDLFFEIIVNCYHLLGKNA